MKLENITGWEEYVLVKHVERNSEVLGLPHCHK